MVVALGGTLVEVDILLVEVDTLLVEDILLVVVDKSFAAVEVDLLEHLVGIENMEEELKSLQAVVAVDSSFFCVFFYLEMFTNCFCHITKSVDSTRTINQGCQWLPG